MRKKFFAVCWILFSLLLLPACSDNPHLPAHARQTEPSYDWNRHKNVTLEIWGVDNDLARPYMQRTFERYQKLTGNKLDIRPMSHPQLEEKLKAGFSGQASELPDAFLFPGGSGLLGMNPDKNFHDFTDATWVEDLTDLALNQTICNGRVVGLPHWESAIAGILYNRQIFEKLGLKPPRSKAEFFAACEQLLANDVIPMYLPFADPTLLLYQFPINSILKDASRLDALNEGKIGYIDMPEMEEIVDWYKIMADKGYFGQDYAGNNWNGMAQAFKSGKYAMMLCWDTWLYSDFDGNPVNLALMPAFVGVPEEGVFEGPNLMLMIVNEQGPKKEAAIELITFMADPFNYNVAFEDFYTAPVFKKQTGSLTTPQYDANARYIEQRLLDSVARPQILGFSQNDAKYIERHMTDPDYSVKDCLRDMDKARLARISEVLPRYIQPDS